MARTELGFHWRKSSRSSKAHCVEIAFAEQDVAARDSKNPDGGMLVFPASRWQDFLKTLRSPR